MCECEWNQWSEMLRRYGYWKRKWILEASLDKTDTYVNVSQNLCMPADALGNILPRISSRKTKNALITSSQPKTDSVGKVCAFCYRNLKRIAFGFITLLISILVLLSSSYHYCYYYCCCSSWYCLFGIYYGGSMRTPSRIKHPTCHHLVPPNVTLPLPESLGTKIWSFVYLQSLVS